MSASARGSDFASWFSNRAALRKDAVEAIGQLHACQNQLIAAAGDTPAAAAAPLSDPSIAGLTAGAQQILTAITQKQAEISRLSSARSAAQTQLSQTQEQVGLAGASRSQEKARKEAERSLRARQAAGWAKQKLFRLASVGVFVSMLYILIAY